MICRSFLSLNEILVFLLASVVFDRAVSSMKVLFSIKYMTIKASQAMELTNFPWVKNTTLRHTDTTNLKDWMQFSY